MNESGEGGRLSKFWADQFIHGAKIARDQARRQMATPGRKIS